MANTSKAMASNELVEQVMQVPEAPLIAQKIQQRLEEEQKRREAFYNSIQSEEQKVEFINGEVVVHSPVKKRHSAITSNLFMMLNTYVVEHDLGFVGYEKIMIRLTRNDYEPDVCYFDREQAEFFEDDTSLFPPPRLVIEVLSPKTEERDRGLKFHDYANHGIPEYWIVAPEENSVEQYLLDEAGKEYLLRKKSDSGEIAVFTLPPLRLPIEAIFDRKKAQLVIGEILRGKDEQD